MKFIPRVIKGIVEIQLEPIIDERGFFMRTYDDKVFRENAIHREWVQENNSLSKQKGIIRGLHFQFPPHNEAKLIRAIKGEVFDVFVDLRRGSPTLGHWDFLNLSSSKNNMIFLPRGIAHGFCTLTTDCLLEYKMDNYYAPERAGIIHWNDPDLKIKWPIKYPLLSDRDSKVHSFKEFITEYNGLEV